ncbi:MAG: hypothetical protein ACR2LQ_05315 [Acidimicrobiales bacterium]
MRAVREARRGYRRTRFAAMGAATVLVLPFFATTGEGGAATSQAIVPGQGSAFADTIKVDPRAGNLSIGIDFGKATASHQNSAAQAVSQAIDLGTIGTSLAAYGCDGSKPSLEASGQPHALIADTRAPDQPQSQTLEESFLPGFTKSVSVNGDPFAEAITTSAPLGAQGLFTMAGGVSHSTSGLVDGVRIATASADVGSLVIAGAINLGSLHWDATWSSDGQQTGTFSAGAISIGGVPLPVENPIAALAQLNALLDTIGMHITPPSMHIDNGVVFVDPLAISVVPNGTRDALFGGVITGVQPIREPAFSALLTAYCKANTEITIADIALGSITGAGSFNLLFGGAQASSGEVSANQFNLGFGGLLGGATPELGSPTLSPGTAGSAGTGATPGRPAIPGNTSTPTGNVAKAAPVAAAASSTKGKRGGAMAAVGLGSLALLALLAEGDRRKMRRAQREIPVPA